MKTSDLDKLVTDLETMYADMCCDGRIIYAVDIDILIQQAHKIKSSNSLDKKHKKI